MSGLDPRIATVTARIIERLNDHLFDGGLYLVGRAFGPASASSGRFIIAHY